MRCDTRESFDVKRPLFTILAAVSLLLFAAIVVLWVRSLLHFEAAIVQRGYQVLCLYNMRGTFVLAWNTVPEEQKPLYSVVHLRAFEGIDAERVLPWEFAASHERGIIAPNSRPTTHRSLLVPHWLVATASLILPVMWIVSTW